MTKLIGVISGIINLTASLPYIYAVARGTARPSRTTWFIWLFLSWVILIASSQSGAKSTLFWLASAAINSTIIAALSLWRGYWEKSALEVICLGIGISGVVIWYLTKDSDYSVYIGVFVDIIAIIPTVKKVWRMPFSEPIIAWTIGICSAVLNLFAIDAARAVIFLPPICVLLWHIAVLTPMWRQKLKPV